MLDGNSKSFGEAVSTIQHSGRISVFLNTDKTVAVWLGSENYSNVKFMPHLQMEWNPDKFKILGIWFTSDLKTCEEISYKEVLSDIKNMYRTWLKRQITPLGRIAVLKSLILSKSHIFGCSYQTHLTN